MKSMTETREMSFEQIIEYLKQNTTIYDLWSEEVKQVADKIERKWWDIRDRGRFVKVNATPALNLEQCCDWLAVYRLSPNYQPPKKAGWVEYDIGMNAIELWQVKEDGRGDFIQGFILHEACVKKGFGGVLYEDCDCRQPRPSHVGVFLMTPPTPCEKHGPHKPVKVRFWKEG